MLNPGSFTTSFQTDRIAAEPDRRRESDGGD
jgi:hypothetical protein